MEKAIMLWGSFKLRVYSQMPTKKPKNNLSVTVLLYIIGTTELIV